MTVNPLGLAFLAGLALGAAGLVAATPALAEQRQTTGAGDDTGNSEQTESPDTDNTPADSPEDADNRNAADHTGDAASTDDSNIVYGRSFDLMIKALEENGFKVELTKDDDGDPRIKSTDEDEPFSVRFYGCDEDSHDGCTYVQFISGWDLKEGISLAKIEEWNRAEVWGQAWIDDSKDPWVAITVNLEGGVTYGNFSDTVDWWRIVMRDFEEHIGWDKE